jgi:hypothetical protein
MTYHQTLVFASRMPPCAPFLAGATNISEADKKKIIDSAHLRFSTNFYTPAVALACLLDPRFRFGTGKYEDYAGVLKKIDGENFLKKYMKQKYTVAETNIVLEEFNRLQSGAIFNLLSDDGRDTIAQADNMPVWRWWLRFHNSQCRNLANMA